MAEKKKTLLERINPANPRERTIEWPFAVTGDDKPKIVLRVLGGDVIEEAHLETVEYFRKQRLPQNKGGSGLGVDVKTSDLPFIYRERAALIQRGIVDEEGQPFARDTAETMALPPDVREVLFAEWSSLQAEAAPNRYTDEDITNLIIALKKNTHSEILVGCPSTLLIRLISTLVAPSSSSTTANGSG